MLNIRFINDRGNTSLNEARNQMLIFYRSIKGALQEHHKPRQNVYYSHMSRTFAFKFIYLQSYLIQFKSLLSQNRFILKITYFKEMSFHHSQTTHHPGKCGQLFWPHFGHASMPLAELELTPFSL